MDGFETLELLASLQAWKFDIVTDVMGMIEQLYFAVRTKILKVYGWSLSTDEAVVLGQVGTMILLG